MGWLGIVAIEILRLGSNIRDGVTDEEDWLFFLQHFADFLEIGDAELEHQIDMYEEDTDSLWLEDA